jgi:hypothetical protein
MVSRYTSSFSSFIGTPMYAMISLITSSVSSSAAMSLAEFVESFTYERSALWSGSEAAWLKDLIGY